MLNAKVADSRSGASDTAAITCACLRCCIDKNELSWFAAATAFLNVRMCFALKIAILHSEQSSAP